ncbi:hypothetical protein BDY17DRAFT_290389 [Neohortaea acidophila]|uniref:Uncharacterized protein n=1 Tax=Neohortaea acidophila TaxID=245834 RepID=A0A6A6Q7B1_9PEZI|nr:uncharacterized protein BDY17DRAFT_290389 [Neohortaea acidophila]KAF2488195.1 hypothetical protein BDY17DRAFT_290389 [Neohortaea acidophila]
MCRRVKASTSPCRHSATTHARPCFNVLGRKNYFETFVLLSIRGSMHVAGIAARLLVARSTPITASSLLLLYLRVLRRHCGEERVGKVLIGFFGGVRACLGRSLRGRLLVPFRSTTLASDALQLPCYSQSSPDGVRYPTNPAIFTRLQQSASLHKT